jgi:hypothetical protein
LRPSVFLVSPCKLFYFLHVFQTVVHALVTAQTKLLRSVEQADVKNLVRCSSPSSRICVGLAVESKAALKLVVN